MTYKFFNNTKHYTLVEILKQIQALEKNFNVVKKIEKKESLKYFYIYNRLDTQLDIK